MKTLIILNEYFANIQYAIIDGDFKHLHDVNLNTGIYSDISKEAKSVLFDDSGKLKHRYTEDIQLVEDKNWDKIAVINFEN